MADIERHSKADLVLQAKRVQKLSKELSKSCLKYASVSEKIAKYKEKVLDVLEAEAQEHKDDALEVFKQLDIRTVEFEKILFTAKIETEQPTSVKYAQVVKDLEAKFGKTVDGFSEALEKIIEANTTLGKVKASSLKFKKNLEEELQGKSNSLNESFLSTIKEKAIKFFTKLSKIVNDILKKNVDSNLKGIKSDFEQLETLGKKKLNESVLIEDYTPEFIGKKYDLIVKVFRKLGLMGKIKMGNKIENKDEIIFVIEYQTKNVISAEELFKLQKFTSSQTTIQAIRAGVYEIFIRISK